jgi:beta-glucosidase
MMARTSVAALLALAAAAAFPTTPLRLEAEAAARHAMDPRFVADARRASAPRRAEIERRVQEVVASLTPLQKLKQVDMWWGNVQLLSNGRINWTAVEAEFGADGAGVVHDTYAPGTAQDGGSIFNALQNYTLNSTEPKIPLLYAEESLHGVAQPGKTVFPAPIGSAASFDKALFYEIGATIAKEARAYGIVLVFAPVIGVGKEPRWGRVVETAGEDVFLTSNYALLFSLGAQGGDPSGASLSRNSSVISGPKHFVAHSAPQGGTNTAPVHVGQRELLESFAPQFEWAVRYGGARNVMSAYHELDGIPSCANPYTLQTLLRDDWGFSGFVLADDGAVKMMQVTHHIAEWASGAMTAFLNAGGNVPYYDWPHVEWQQALLDCLANGTLPADVLDARVADMVRVKMELGLFDQPFSDVGLIDTNVNTPEAQDLAYRAAAESIVLLQNNPVGAAVGAAADGPPSLLAGLPLLPLQLGTAIKTLAVIGPSADTIRDGDYSGQGVASNFVTLLEGLQAAAAAATGSGVTVLYEQGTGVTTGELTPVRRAYLTTPAGDSAGVLGSYWPGDNSSSTAGPPAFTRVDWDVNLAWYAYNPSAYIKTPLLSGAPFYDALFTATYAGVLTPPTSVPNATLSLASNGDPVRLVFAGRTIIDTFANASNPTSATVDLDALAHYPFTVTYTRASSDAGAEIILQWSLAPDEDAGILRAATLASAADAVVLAIGESDSTVGEGIDSDTLLLPGRQAELAAAVVAAGKPVVAVLLHGRPLAIADLAAAVPALLSCWFPGQAQGRAIADVLTGVVNPAGRSPMTWPLNVGQLPVYYNPKPSARTSCYYDTHCDYPNGVFPFGFGLSYSTFTYANLTLSAPTVAPDGTLNITVTVTNTGAVDGEDVPQLYVRDAVASVTTPIKQLKGFERVAVPAAGGKGGAGSAGAGSAGAVQVTFSLLPERDLYVVDGSYTRVVEPGLFTFFVAGSSAPGEGASVVSGNFTVTSPGGRPWTVRMGPLEGIW